MNKLFDLSDRVAVLTGGCGFLGRQYSQALHEAGAKVAIFDVRGENAGGDIGLTVDITDPGSVRAAVSDVIAHFGRIDILINNAAMNPAVIPGANGGPWAAYEDFSPELWRKEMEVNLSGQMFVTQAVAPVMMKQKSGSIIFISSDLGMIGPNNSLYDEGKFKDIAYGTAKAGVLGMMRFWAARLGSFNVRVNALAPGGMNSNHSEEFAKKNGALNMLGRMAQPGEFNGAMLFLASDASAFVTGSCLHVDGGRTAW